MSINRRDFLKGAAVTGVAVAGATLTGCSSAGDSSSSTDIGNNDGATVYTWEIKPDPITDIASTEDFDIVIVGAGASGNAAAESAAANGAKVVVLEQSNKISARGGDNGSVNNSYQNENGVELDPDACARLTYKWSQQMTNYQLIRTWADQSGKVFDHLRVVAEKYGNSMAFGVSPTAKTGWDKLDETFREYTTACSFIQADGDDGLFTAEGEWVQIRIMDSIYQEALANGATYIFNTRAEQLIQDDDGKVTGVVSTAEDGSHIQYNAAKGVVLASGDIGGNDEMINAWAPLCTRTDPNMYQPTQGNVGDGMLMGMWAGAARQKAPAAPMIHPLDFSDNAVLGPISMCWLGVENTGKRYGAEMAFEPYVTNARVNAPGNVTYSIFDSNYAKYAQAQFPESYQTLLDGVEQKLEAQVSAGKYFRADSLDDLASQLEMPADTFKSTVERYNSWYEGGEDKDFAVPKRFLTSVDAPPFYALPIPAPLLVCIFGLNVDNNSQVCREDDTPIPGLFAIGNMQGNFFGLSYPVHCPGISHGRAFTFGNLIGEALAKDTVISSL